ncbi:molybdopterin molybdenumtransferase MoeA [Litorivita pollutaquae]|uniref:Molybdopterin molybdenumtransferase n=1 Tax=Litorivita pollutaquae TaxID=2200892 RepID=A0A2V4NWA1_9RHOB|nr:gephyrin-like molybdotransferase Glp [Litorivita pollutaquae]PYC49386.1 molybdopterin molybdenumtransferase MoeA [Litorivita pollutaquae]
MISVPEALDLLFALAKPLGHDIVPLRAANGRVLANDVTATRTQPPFAASAMDGYAVIKEEAVPDATFKVIGESAAGHGWRGDVRSGEAVRIFTGAPVPEGATRVILQEDVMRISNEITLTGDIGSGDNIRAAGGDFKAGDVIKAPRRIGPADVALMASMNIAEVPVMRRPDVALISTGDELVMPGETPGPDQIIASNTFGLYAMLQDLGAMPRLLPIAQDTPASLEMCFDLAKGADLVVTVGGASVGDHDIVGTVAASLGMEQSFYKVAMRPGKPLMAGRMADGALMLGLPGNPVSAMVCGTVFLAPMVRVMMGLPPAPAPRRRARLAADMPAGGPREHYLRAKVDGDEITPFNRQDSALLGVLAEANALLVQPPNSPALPAGTHVDYIPL